MWMHGCLAEIRHPGQIEVFHGIDSLMDTRPDARQQQSAQTTQPLYQQASLYRRWLAMMMIDVNSFDVEGYS